MKFKLSFTQIDRLQKTILVGTVFLMILISGVFLYKNFYKTIAGSQKVILLSDEIAEEKINADLFNKVIKNIENKKAASKTDWATFKNPFLPYQVDEALSDTETEPQELEPNL